MTKYSINLVIGLVFILALFSSVIMASETVKPVSVNKSEEINKIVIKPSPVVRQGETAFFILKSTNNLKNPYFEFKNKKVRLYSEGNGVYRGILGIDAGEKPGYNSLSFADESGKLDKEAGISVVKVKFPVQNIRISGGKSTLVASQYELDKVDRAKKTISESSFWDNFPFESPTKGCILSVYGLNRYHNGVPTGDYHRGVDIQAPQGQAVRSITGGKVLIAEQLRLHGGTVAIDHGQGLVSIYLHLSKTLVKEGQNISQGDIIGKVGSTGFSTGPHLHFGLYINGIPVNPSYIWVKGLNKC